MRRFIRRFSYEVLFCFLLVSFVFFLFLFFSSFFDNPRSSHRMKKRRSWFCQRGANVMKRTVWFRSDTLGFTQYLMWKQKFIGCGLLIGRHKAKPLIQQELDHLLLTPLSHWTANWIFSPPSPFREPVQRTAVMVSYLGRVSKKERFDKLFCVEKKKRLEMYMVSTVSGSGIMGIKDGTGEESQFSSPCGIIISRDGKYLFVANNRSVRKVSVDDGRTSTIAGITGTVEGKSSIPIQLKNAQKILGITMALFQKPNLKVHGES